MDGFSDLDTAQRWVDDWQSAIEQRAAATQAMADRLSSLQATATGGDGLVEVTVATSGALLDLKLDERIRSQPAARTAELILATIGEARAKIAGLARETVAQTVGVDSRSGAAVMRSLDHAEGCGS